MKTRALLLIFLLELEIFGVAVQSIHGIAEELLSENYFKAVLAFFCCYDHGANAFEAVQKIATDQSEFYP